MPGSDEHNRVQHRVQGVGCQDIAERAGVSRALLYHYSATKRDLARAVVERESATLRNLIDGKSLEDGPSAYLDYVETHRHGYRVLHSGELAGDDEIQLTLRGSLDHHENTIIALLGMPASNTTVHLAVRGWIGFLVTICLEWLADPAITRPTVERPAVRTLHRLVGPLGDDDQAGA